MAFRILSLDGGGIRGAFTAAFLAEVERELGGSPLGQYFDLIAGTSTGGIIAMALALGEPAEKIRSFYESRGPQIFKRLPMAKLPIKGKVAFVAGTLCRGRLDRFLAKYGMSIDDFLQAKYDSRELERSLKDVFGSKTLEDATTRLVIPSVDLSCGKTVVFKTPHLPDLTRDRVYSAVDVVLATSAAPTYFPHAVIRQGSAYCDGGLWANNPAIVAYAEMCKIQEKSHPRFELSDVVMLSVGTGKPKHSLAPPDIRAGLGWWAPRLIDTMFMAQAEGIRCQTHYLLGDRHHRVDYDLPDNTWKLDSVDLIPRLFHFGSEEAHSQLKNLRPIFFNASAPKYTPHDPKMDTWQASLTDDAIPPSLPPAGKR